MTPQKRYRKQDFNIGDLLSEGSSKFHELKKSIKTHESKEFKKAQKLNTSTRLKWYEDRTVRQ